MTVEEFKRKWPCSTKPFGEDLGYYAWCAMYEFSKDKKRELLLDFSYIVEPPVFLALWEYCFPTDSPPRKINGDFRDGSL
jgi:hypothetical protein